jgi:hypothetical protein
VLWPSSPLMPVEKEVLNHKTVTPLFIHN